MPQFLKNPIINFTFQLFLTIIVFFFITEIPLILKEIQPDSSGYINFESYRKSLYPTLLNSLNLLGINILTIQKFIFSFSIIYLFFKTLEFKVNPYLCLLLLLLLIFNIYYISYARIILPESFFFSSINFLLAAILKKDSFFKFIFIGLMLGLIFNLKHIGPVISIVALFIIFFTGIVKTDVKKFYLIIVPVVFLTLLENYCFYQKHEHRNSVFYNTVIGKLFILSGKKSFDINSYPEKLKDLLVSSKSFYSKTYEFLDEIKNPVLKADYAADWEVHAQYQFLERFKATDDLKIYLRENSNSIFLNILIKNPLDYLLLTSSHYLGLWSAGMSYLYPDPKSMPYFEELGKVSGFVKYDNKKLLFLSQVFFLILFALSLLILFLTSLNFRRNNLLFGLSVIIQVYLVSVSFFNVATIRYLMPVYPLLIFSVIIFFNINKSRN